MEERKGNRLGVEEIKVLLAVYGIEDDSNELSNKINITLGSLLNTHSIVYSEEVSSIYDEVLQAIQLRHILGKSLCEDVTIKAKGFPNMKLTNKRIKNRILQILEDLINSYSELDILIAKNHFLNVPSRNEKLGFYCTTILNRIFNDSNITSLTKSEQYSLIYDLLFKAGEYNARSDCRQEGYKHGGREKYLQVNDWIRAYRNYYQHS